MDVVAYRNIGIFSTKSNLETFEKLCDDIGIQSEFLLECFIDSVARSFKVDKEIWTKEDFAARAFYEAMKEEDLLKEGDV